MMVDAEPVECPTKQIRSGSPVVAPSRPAADADPFAQVTNLLAEFVLLADLGRGATSRVVLARQPAMGDRPVVLKVTRNAGGEVHSLARLLHTHVVPLLFAHDLPGDVQVLAMPYLGGAPLSAVLRALEPIPPARRTGADLITALDAAQKDLPLLPPASPWRERLARAPYVSAVCWLAACLADALHHAHECELVHFDVKPDNVLLAGDARPLLLDFHLAQPPVSAGVLPTSFGGSPGYLAPEHARAVEAVLADRAPTEPVDGRADVYSLGVVLYEALAGRRPQAGENVSAALRRHNPTVSVGLADLTARALADDPARRYLDAASLAADLRRHLADEPLAGVRERSWRERWSKWRRRRPYAFARLSLLLLGLAALSGTLSLAGRHYHVQRQLAETALADGRACLASGRPGEAEAALHRGQAAAWYPGNGPTQTALGEEAQRAATARQRQAVEPRREKLLRDLHDLADDLRLFHDLTALSPRDAEALDRRCASVWQRRDLLAEGAWDENQRRDFVDLVSLWAEVSPNGDDHLAEAMRLADLPHADEAWEAHRRGRTLLARGDLAGAQRELSRAVALRPGAFWPNFHQGVCAYRRKSHQRAAEAFAVCVALAPRSAPCYLNRALALTGLGREQEALADLDRALELDERLASAWLQRGMLHAQAGRDSKKAEADLERALELGADPFAVHRNLAVVAQKRGDQEGCRAHLREALRSRPGDETTRQALRALER